ncbi:hypothetical protein PSEUBRA_000012 [Kalmanozyma brasiliensis GHG001]|uniref:Uncharacterized protein n=1 Tax=Kalmanozyma brasiliensis (strain GHG001) TaxID=1365824 RepID=V5GUR5_KALBG|nr:uncharacterized protein PSEUBRA_000012 [Kalmanozyma brasiliensis GHG001]EST09642.1 hypothetical protein PSEUBRA_000012 [Kalmanozyma brasiliensis GHG001]
MLASEPPFTNDAENELLTSSQSATLSGLLNEPESTRLSVYCYFLGSDDARTAALLATSIPQPLFPLCLVLRYLILKEAQRLGESSVRFNWSLKQVQAAVASGVHAHTVHETLKADPTLTGLPDNLAHPDPLSVEPTTKDVHLQSSLQLTLHSAYQLAQSLLLCPEPFSAPPSALVLGSLFHTIAQSNDDITREDITTTSTQVEKEMLDWILRDTEQHLAIDVEALRKAKRERKREEKKVQTAAAEAEKKKAATARQKAVRSGFGLLQLDNEDGEDESEEE